MKRIKRAAVWTSLLLSGALTLNAQLQEPAAVSEPEQSTSNDPLQLMRLAAELNRVVYPGAQPWHLKAEYDVLNSSGKKVENGVFEVFWAGQKKFRQSYSSKTFSQTDYMTEKGLYRTGDPRWASGPERVIASQTFSRMPTDATLARTSQQIYPQTIDGKTYRCVTLNSIPPVAATATLMLPSYCLDADRLALRYERGTGPTSSEVSGDTFFADIAVFHGHFVARDIRVSHFDKPYLKIRVTALEDLPQINDADFQPPTSAAPVGPQRPVISNAVMAARLIQRKNPDSMPVQSWVQGDQRVVLSIIVGKDGTVTSVRAVSGWKDLQTLTAKAVSQWVYRPYVANGEPIEVETEVVEEFARTSTAGR